MNAWMASKAGHKENLLNSKYQNIGMAVVEGTLNGQKTILVVQEFGTTEFIASKPTINADAEKTVKTLAQIPVNTLPAQAETLTSGFRFDPYSLTKTLGFSLIGLLTFLILLDFLIIRNRKKAVVNLYTRHIPHFAILPLATGLLSSLGPGSIM